MRPLSPDSINTGLLPGASVSLADFRRKSIHIETTEEDELWNKIEMLPVGGVFI